MAHSAVQRSHYPAVFLSILFPIDALAHQDVQKDGFLAGLTHPVLGVDHLLAMVAVGIISAQIGGRAIWTIPATFVTVMAVGAVIGWSFVPLPYVEFGIVISVVVLGLAIALDKRFPVGLTMGCVGFFAIFHGYAHGTEMPKAVNPALYALGFILATAGLHILGVLIGHVLTRTKRRNFILRLCGCSISLFGFLLLGLYIYALSR